MAQAKGSKSANTARKKTAVPNNASAEAVNYLNSAINKGRTRKSTANQSVRHSGGRRGDERTTDGRGRGPKAPRGRKNVAAGGNDGDMVLSPELQALKTKLYAAELNLVSAAISSADNSQINDRDQGMEHSDEIEGQDSGLSGKILLNGATGDRSNGLDGHDLDIDVEYNDGAKRSGVQDTIYEVND